ncbi:hemolysin family protein [Azohydromonas caseinilytica]|uniref:Polyamine export protein n=1 Tax=Azohydromonas caseinilytica TaxID=2728836 RepID=A0A848FCG0_9BURK|nr:hemolysin family protein [Azohydromonas caseinilytica]NML16455.1 HlyC/CorC family transporter [Azohydromonas caseinilytica]
MDSAGSLFTIALLIALSAFFSVAELSMASARRLRLRQLAEEGDVRAERVLQVQSQPGSYFTVVQIGQNMVAILGGVVGEDALSPYAVALLEQVLPARSAELAGFLLSFSIVTSLFILFADLLPKRLALTQPERLAMRLLTPMRWWMRLLAPVVWLFNGLADALMRLLGLPQQRDERITSADILALTEAGAEAGVLHVQEQEVIENIFELETRTVESAMTTRDRIVYLLQDEAEEIIRARIAAQPHSTYLVCDGHIDQVVGYVDAADLFARVLRKEPIALHGEAAKGLLKKVLMVPDRLTLSEVLTQFRQAHEDFAVIVNEYSLVVGVITLNDVMSTVMGSMVLTGDEEQIVRREDGSWLMDGLTPIGDVLRALHLDPAELPQRGQYDTLAGFLMVRLRRIPRRTDRADWNGYRFEVIDVDSTRIDQVLVTALGDDVVLPG